MAKLKFMLAPDFDYAQPSDYVSWGHGKRDQCFNWG
jgi:hypothetical protein